MIRSRRLRHFALLLALFGVLLRGAIPAGFMPVFGGDDARGSWLMLCSGGELQRLPIDWRGSFPAQQHADGHELQMQQECPYAAAATPSLPSNPPQFVPQFAGMVEATRSFNPLAPERRLRALPPARGPPDLL